MLKDNTKRYYANNDMLVADYPNQSNAAYMLPNPGDLSLTGGNYIVDVNGNDITISGSGSVSLFDSANANYISCIWCIRPKL